MVNYMVRKADRIGRARQNRRNAKIMIKGYLNNGEELDKHDHVRKGSFDCGW
jgi:hypothetical protein